MTKICNLLRAAGLQAVPPEPDDATSSALEIKRTASKHHMDRIRSDDTEAVLVVNVSRPGAENYVGPNALAEIGVAFALDRKVFLLYGMPASYADELRAWGVTCLDGKINRLLTTLAAPGTINSADWEATLHYAHASGQ